MRAMHRAASLLIVFAFITAACARDDGAGEYLGSVASINETMARDTFAALPRDADPTWDRVQGVVRARSAALGSLGELTPPERLGVHHDAYVITLRALVDEMNRFMTETEDLDDDAFITTLASTETLRALAEAVGRACSALQAAGNETGQGTELRC